MKRHEHVAERCLPVPMHAERVQTMGIVLALVCFVSMLAQCIILRSSLVPSTLFCVYVTGIPDLVLDIVAITAIAARYLLKITSVIVQPSNPDVSDVADPSDARMICPDA